MNACQFQVARCVIDSIPKLCLQTVFVSALFLLLPRAEAQRIRNSVPVERVPANQLIQRPVVQSFPEVEYLRAPKQKEYLLDAGDVLGVFLEGLLGQIGEAPPVNYPPEGSSLGPSIGYPTVVRPNGMILLPAVDPISVRGLTIQQAEALVKSAYLSPRESGKRILTGQSRIIVTLQQKRTINVVVIRADHSNSTRPLGASISNTGAVSDRSDQSARGSSLQLPAGDNDVFNALIETGGLPGLNAENVTLFRATPKTTPNYQSPSQALPFPRSNSAVSSFPRTGFPQHGTPVQSQPSGTNIPLRQSSASQPLDNRHARLSSGDLVVVQARPTEVYYTGGLLRGGEFQLPRDKSLTVLDAVALAGGSTANNNSQFGIANLPPTELIVSRNNGLNGQVTIRVDLNRALNDPSQNILVAPGDHLLLRHKTADQIRNLGIGTFNNFGIRRIFQ